MNRREKLSLHGKKESKPLIKGFDPQKTKKLVFAAVMLIITGMVALALCRDRGLLTNDQALTAGWVLCGICFILLMIDTLAQKKSTAFSRIIGSAPFIFYFIYRYLF